MRCRCWFVTLSVLLLGLGVLLTLTAAATRPQRFINWDAFGRIAIGMTAEEVQAILGLPPGDHSVFRFPPVVEVEDSWPEPTDGSSPVQARWWQSDAGVILVYFLDNKVIRRDFADATGAPRRDFLNMLGRLVPAR